MKKTVLLLPLLCISLSGCDLNSIMDSINDVINSFSYKELSDEEFDELVNSIKNKQVEIPDQINYVSDFLMTVDEAVYNQTSMKFEYIKDTFMYQYASAKGDVYKETLMTEAGMTQEAWLYIENDVHILAQHTKSVGSEIKQYKEVSEEEFKNLMSSSFQTTTFSDPQSIFNTEGVNFTKRRGDKNGYLEAEFTYSKTTDGSDYKGSFLYKDFLIRSYKISGKQIIDEKEYDTKGSVTATYSGVSAKKPNLDGFEKK